MVYWAQLDREAALILRQWSLLPIFRHARRRLWLGCRPSSLIFNIVQVLSINEWSNLLLETESIDERLLLLLDRVFIRAINRWLFKRKLVLFVLNLDRPYRLSLHHWRGHISVETHRVGAVLPIRHRAVLPNAWLCAAPLHV